VGGSSGSAMAGALKWLKSEEGWKRVGSVEGANAVILLPDGIRNYMSKPWFRDAGIHDKASGLAQQIEGILSPLKAHTASVTNGVNGHANGHAS